jgi:Zn-dependent M28 family amino/carboxypeptidase
MIMRSTLGRVAGLSVLLAACVGGEQRAPAPGVDAVALAVAQARARGVDHIRILSADSLEGRLIGSEGNRKARDYIAGVYRSLNLSMYAGTYLDPFEFQVNEETWEGSNVVGYVEGTDQPDRFIVVTAHFDHLGVREGAIFNGADDNASGTAGLLMLAEHFSGNPARHSLIFAAFDGEEGGLRGARHFVSDPPIPVVNMALNVNLDMISHNDSVLYVAGGYHTESLKSVLDAVASESAITLCQGHDSPDRPEGDDWTMSSDHGPFHVAGVPFVYFGVEDHPDYHQASDTFETINQQFFLDAVETVKQTILTFDRKSGR